MSQPILKTENLTFRYTTAEGAAPTVLDGLTLSVRRGEFVAVLGHNGSGKSTLAKHFNAILLPSGGKAYVDGMDTCDENLLLDIRRRVGMVFQNPDNQIVASVVEEDVAFGPENLGVPSEEIRARVDSALAAVGMTEYARHAPHLLSGGQKQRVAIARALATNPKVLLCDEATSALDPATTESILALIKDINRRLGITAVIITHEMSVIEKICNQVAIISHGVIAETGSVEEVFFHPQTEEARQLVIPEALQPEQMPHSRLYRIIFNGRSSFEPIIGNMVLECGSPVNIMFADTRDIGGTAFGQMVLQLPDDEEVARRILAYADKKGLMLEAMNHV